MNNAGIAPLPALLHEIPLETWDRILAINLRGVMRCMRAELAQFMSSGGGAIVNMCSCSGLITSAMRSVSATIAAVRWPPSNNAISPKNSPAPIVAIVRPPMFDTCCAFDDHNELVPGGTLSSEDLAGRKSKLRGGACDEFELFVGTR